MRTLMNGLTLALCLSACGQAPADSRDAQNVSFLELDQLDLSNGGGVYKATREDATVEIPFDVDLASIDPVRRHDSERVGQTTSGVVVLLDRYASKAAPNGRCASGIESFVRAFSLQQRKELLAIPAESCLRGRTGPDTETVWLSPDGFRVGNQRYSIEGQKIVVAQP